MNMGRFDSFILGWGLSGLLMLGLIWYGYDAGYIHTYPNGMTCYMLP